MIKAWLCLRVGRILWIIDAVRENYWKAPRAAGAGLRYAIFRAKYPGADVEVFSMRSGADIEISRGGRIRIGKQVRMMQEFTARVEGQLAIGDNVFFGRAITISAREYVTIGSNCMFAEHVSIHDNDHDPYRYEDEFSMKTFKSGPIVIGDGVWVGAKATILAGVEIGNNVIVGANSVVTKDLPEGCVAVGVPAKVIRENWNWGRQ